MLDDHCAQRVKYGAFLGGVVGCSFGTVYGTYEAFANQVPGMLKIRHIGRNAVGSAAVFGVMLGAGSLLQCGRR